MTRQAKARARSNACPLAQGFTLVEILVVVAMVAILAALAIVSLQGASARSKVAASRASLATLAVAIEAFRADRNDYPGANDGHNANLGSEWRFQLTTPVAYLRSSDALIDPWNKQRQGEDRFYEYGNMERPFSLDSRSITYHKSLYGAWALFGAGPLTSLREAVDDTVYLYGPTLNGYTQRVALRYDATNGVVSPGLVMRSQKSVNGWLN